jgi:hypothetical protein
MSLIRISEQLAEAGVRHRVVTASTESSDVASGIIAKMQALLNKLNKRTFIKSDATKLIRLVDNLMDSTVVSLDERRTFSPAYTALHDLRVFLDKVKAGSFDTGNHQIRLRVKLDDVLGEISDARSRFAK